MGNCMGKTTDAISAYESRDQEPAKEESDEEPDGEASIKRIKDLKQRSTALLEFDEAELTAASKSIERAAASKFPSQEYKAFMKLHAHKNFPDWAATEAVSQELGKIVVDPKTDPAVQLSQIFKRLYEEGQWESALKHAKQRPGQKPWMVLVAGVNGIRKSTCMYQTWLAEALHASIKEIPGQPSEISKEELPTGRNSFFRQLDYLIPTVASEDFRSLYAMKANDLEKYTAIKEGIFARYRNVAQFWGALMLREAQKQNVNVMIETTGQNPGMIFFVEHFFPSDTYNKLYVHFKIDEISPAMTSVDGRMQRELEAGQRLQSRTATAEEVIAVNKGGCQVSKVLEKVSADSMKIWEDISAGKFAKSWFKASIMVNAQEAQPSWTATDAKHEIKKVDFI